MNDDDLNSRLTAMEARAPGAQKALPALGRASRRTRLFAPIALAPALVLAIAATAAAGGAVAGMFAAQAHPGAENPGQPLAGAGLECMSPSQAATYLTNHGFTNVVWQVETGSVTGKTGTTTQQATPPEHGFVIPGAFLGDGQLIMIIDQRTEATGVGACFNEPMP
jgi:hypothetical protein